MSLLNGFGKSLTQYQVQNIYSYHYSDQLINKIAKKLGIQKVVFANTCTKLTIELLSNVAIGKGAHISGESVRLTSGF